MALAIILDIVARHSLHRTPAVSMRAPPPSRPGPLYLEPLPGMGALRVGPRCSLGQIVGFFFIGISTALRTYRSAAPSVSESGALYRAMALYVSSPRVLRAPPGSLIWIGPQRFLSRRGLYRIPLLAPIYGLKHRFRRIRLPLFC